LIFLAGKERINKITIAVIIASIPLPLSDNATLQN
jgi:hypothetical protein